MAINAFSHCRNNPVVYFDPYGYSAIPRNYENNLPDILGIPGLIIALFSLWLLLKDFISTISQTTTSTTTTRNHNNQAVFPSNPNNFSPRGLIKTVYVNIGHGSNGGIIKWIDPATKIAVFEWDEDWR